MAEVEELTKLPVALGLKVNEILRKKTNFKPREDKSGILLFKYTKEELEKVEKLEIINPSKGELKGIDLLPNLKTLKISSTIRTNTPYTQEKHIASISDDDAKLISKCSKIRYLDIENQSHLTYLNVSNLKELHILSLKRNSKLEDVYGMDRLKDIWILDCFGNENLTQIKELNKTIMQNKELTDLNLDVLLFPDAIGYDSKIQSIMNQKLEIETLKKLNQMNTTWTEILSSGKDIKINNNQMQRMHNVALKVLNEYVPEKSDKYTIVVGIEKYLSENVKYDMNSLDHKHSHTTQEENPIVIGPLNGANGAYNAFMYNTCVCEGYTRAMQYLLNLKGIKSHNVHCISGKDTLHMASNENESMYKTYRLPDDGYHSIICIDDINYLYDDPCWNAGKYQEGDKSLPWTLLTKSEISQDHTLSFSEKNIDNESYKVPRYYIENAQKKIDDYKKNIEEQR